MNQPWLLDVGRRGGLYRRRLRRCDAADTKEKDEGWSYTLTTSEMSRNPVSICQASTHAAKVNPRLAILSAKMAGSWCLPPRSTHPRPPWLDNLSIASSARDHHLILASSCLLSPICRSRIESCPKVTSCAAHNSWYSPFRSNSS